MHYPLSPSSHTIGTTCTSIAGYLQKQTSGAVKRWQKRWFVVAGHYLRYYKSEPKERLDPAQVSGECGEAWWEVSGVW